MKGKRRIVRLRTTHPTGYAEITATVYGDWCVHHSFIQGEDGSPIVLTAVEMSVSHVPSGLAVGQVWEQRNGAHLFARWAAEYAGTYLGEAIPDYTHEQVAAFKAAAVAAGVAPETWASQEVRIG